jgi:hypothetical protein
MTLRYADPEAQLTDPPRNDDDEVEPVVYRNSLATDRGLSVGGAAAACSAELDGIHSIEGMDPGDYRLEVTVDGRACAIVVALEAETTTTVDLANLPCDG